MEENVLRIIEKVIENSRNYDIKVTPDGELTISVKDEYKITPITYPSVEPLEYPFTSPWTYSDTITKTYPSTGTEHTITYANISNTSDNKE